MRGPDCRSAHRPAGAADGQSDPHRSPRAASGRQRRWRAGPRQAPDPELGKVPPRSARPRPPRGCDPCSGTGTRRSPDAEFGQQEVELWKTKPMARLADFGGLFGTIRPDASSPPSSTWPSSADRAAGQVQQRRLAGTRRPGDGDKLAAPDRKVHAAQDVHAPSRREVALLHTAKLEDGRHGFHLIAFTGP